MLFTNNRTKHDALVSRKLQAPDISPNHQSPFAFGLSIGYLPLVGRDHFLEMTPKLKELFPIINSIRSLIPNKDKKQA
jgi:hypothetical protein